MKFQMLVEGKILKKLFVLLEYPDAVFNQPIHIKMSL